MIDALHPGEPLIQAVYGAIKHHNSLHLAKNLVSFIIALAVFNKKSTKIECVVLLMITAPVGLYLHVNLWNHVAHGASAGTFFVLGASFIYMIGDRKILCLASLAALLYHQIFIGNPYVAVTHMGSFLVGAFYISVRKEL